MQVFKIRRSSFYRWYTAGPSKRALEHSLTDLIKKELDLSKQRYGATRIAEKLKREGYCISRCRVTKIMRANHWVNTNGSLIKAITDSKLQKKVQVLTNTAEKFNLSERSIYSIIRKMK